MSLSHARFTDLLVIVMVLCAFCCGDNVDHAIADTDLGSDLQEDKQVLLQ